MGTPADEQPGRRKDDLTDGERIARTEGLVEANAGAIERLTKVIETGFREVWQRLDIVRDRDRVSWPLVVSIIIGVVTLLSAGAGFGAMYVHSATEPLEIHLEYQRAAISDLSSHMDRRTGALEAWVERWRQRAESAAQRGR